MITWPKKNNFARWFALSICNGQMRELGIPKESMFLESETYTHVTCNSYNENECMFVIHTEETPVGYSWPWSGGFTLHTLYQAWQQDMTWEEYIKLEEETWKVSDNEG